MGEFKEIFNNVNGWQQLRQYAKAHVLLFALTQTSLTGLSRKSLEIVRLAVNNRIYTKLKKENKRFIDAYVQQHNFASAAKLHRNVIWTSWLQGMDQAPYIVRQCYDSVKKNITDKEIILITEDNYCDYIKLPDYIIEKYHRGMISKAHFADLVRIELIAKYGGTWLDGTVYCSGVPVQKYILDSNLFLFQNLKPGLDGHCTSISNWLITASTNNPIIMLTRALLHQYWKTHDFAIDYFIWHYFFQMAIETYPDEWKKVVPFSNSIPHILLLRLFNQYDDDIWNAVKEMTSFHKLSYKFTEEQAQLNGTYYKTVLE